MSQIARSPRQITVFYDPDSCRCLKVLAIIRAQGFPIQDIDISRNPPTKEQLFEIADLLQMSLSELVNRYHPVYMKRFAEYDFSDEDWATIICKNPQILKNPIVIHGDKAFLISSPMEATKV